MFLPPPPDAAARFFCWCVLFVFFRIHRMQRLVLFLFCWVFFVVFHLHRMERLFFLWVFRFPCREQFQNNTHIKKKLRRAEIGKQTFKQQIGPENRQSEHSAAASPPPKAWMAHFPSPVCHLKLVFVISARLGFAKFCYSALS